MALTVALARARTDWLLPSATYLVVQMLIFSALEPLSKPWITTASLLWLVIYQVGVSSLTKTEEHQVQHNVASLCARQTHSVS